MSASYIPSTDSALLPWATNFAVTLAANPGNYAQSAATATAVSAAVNTFITDYNLYGSANRKPVNGATRTPAGVAQLGSDKAYMIGLLRSIAVLISANNGINNDLKTAIGVTVRKTNKTPVPTPTTQPILNLSIPSSGSIQVRFADSATPTLKKKPVGSTQMLIFGAPSATVVADPSTLPFIQTLTKNPTVIEFDPTDKGKTFYFAAKWNTQAGKEGSFGLIYSIVLS